MEILAYTHICIAREEATLNPGAYELTLFERTNWKPPSSAWIPLLVFVSPLSILSLARNALTLPPVQPPLAWEYQRKSLSQAEIDAAKRAEIDVSNITVTPNAVSPAKPRRGIATNSARSSRRYQARTYRSRRYRSRTYRSNSYQGTTNRSNRYQRRTYRINSYQGTTIRSNNQRRR